MVENAGQGLQRWDPSAQQMRGAGAAGDVEVEQAAKVEGALQQAMNRGDFDDLPGAGKPLRGMDRPHDPDWWIRDKIETEQIRGLGPAALTLRGEDTELEETLDSLRSETEVRKTLEDFNRRVIEARRQLMGGPPVLTKTRDIDAEIAAWHYRKSERQALVQAQCKAKQAEQTQRPRRRRIFRRRG